MVKKKSGTLLLMCKALKLFLVPKDGQLFLMKEYVKSVVMQPKTTANLKKKRLAEN